MWNRSDLSSIFPSVTNRPEVLAWRVSKNLNPNHTCSGGSATCAAASESTGALWAASREHVPNPPEAFLEALNPKP